MTFFLANALLIPLLLVAATVIGYAWVDIVGRSTRALPSALWASAVFLLFPVGVLLYLVFGRTGSRRRDGVPWYGRFRILFPTALVCLLAMVVVPLILTAQHLSSGVPHPGPSLPPSP